jgi:hypothetical protein
MYWQFGASSGLQLDIDGINGPELRLIGTLVDDIPLVGALTHNPATIDDVWDMYRESREIIEETYGLCESYRGGESYEEALFVHLCIIFFFHRRSGRPC